MSPMNGMITMALVPLIGYIATILYNGIKTLFPWYDRRPALVHQILAPAFAFVFGWLTTKYGLPAITDIHSVNAEWIGGLLTMLANAGIFRWLKSKTASDTTTVIEASRASNPPAMT